MKTDILEKIETLFWEHAFAEVSMDEIAKTLEMKKASLYYHFPSKEEMFREVLEFSFGKYRTYMEDLLEKGDIDTILSGIVSYPLESKNLFAIVSQKWYCKIDIIRDMIMAKNQELFGLFFAYFHKKYGFNEARAMLLQNLLHDLGKKYCIFDCKETLDSQALIQEIKKIFF